MEYVWMGLVGLVSGWLAGLIVKGGGMGLFGNLIVGIVGAFLGDWILRDKLGVTIGSGMLGGIATATIGAIILLLVMGLFTRKR